VAGLSAIWVALFTNNPVPTMMLLVKSFFYHIEIQQVGHATGATEESEFVLVE
jgi:hypothetical protein